VPFLAIHCPHHIHLNPRPSRPSTPTGSPPASPAFVAITATAKITRRTFSDVSANAVEANAAETTSTAQSILEKARKFAQTGKDVVDPAGDVAEPLSPNSSYRAEMERYIAVSPPGSPIQPPRQVEPASLAAPRNAPLRPVEGTPQPDWLLQRAGESHMIPSAVVPVAVDMMSAQSELDAMRGAGPDRWLHD
jgi:hypothetical protein